MTNNKYFDLFSNASLNRLAIVIRVSIASEDWRQRHPDLTIWHDWDRVQKIIKGGWHETETPTLIESFIEVVAGVVASDPICALHAPEDFVWWIERAQRCDSLALNIWMAKCYLHPADDMITPAELAKLTNTAESGWRNKAHDSKIPGAIQKGKQWLLPKSALRLMGIIE